MKKIFLLIFSMNCICLPSYGQLNEAFDNDAGFTKNEFASDGGSDYFGIFDPNDVAFDFDGGSNPSGVPGYTGFSGTYLAGEDLDGDGTNPGIITWVVPISGLTSISFTAKVAADQGTIDSANDLILFEYDIDGVGFNNLLAFEGPPTGFNQNFAEDTNFDGLQDGAVLNIDAQTFMKTISGTGTTLTLRLTVNLNSDGEEIAIDDIIISGSTVPVKLTSFIAKKSPSFINLHWSTSTEIDNDHFVVERSTNRIDFKEIGMIQGNGTTNETQDYSFTDRTPAAGINYYRLAQYDFNGEMEYHPVIAVKTDRKTTSIHPTLAHDFLNLEVTGESSILIMNANGQVVLQKNIDSSQRLNISHLSPGIYTVSVNTDSRREVHRFIKQ